MIKSRKISYNAIKIIERLKLFLNIKTDTELAELLGIKQNTISGWKERNSIRLENFIDKLDNINLHWLITGYGDMYISKENVTISEPKVDYNSKSNEIEIKIKIDPISLTLKR